MNEGCIDANEYEFCKDTLAVGGRLQLSALDSLTCDFDRCTATNQCTSSDPNGGGGGGGGSSQPPAGDVPPGDYVLTVVSAEYTDKDWDGLGSAAPDPYVEVFVDGDRVGVSNTLENTYTPEWDARFDITLSANSAVELRFYDEDVAVDDAAGRYTINDLAGAIRSGGRSTELSGADVEGVVFEITER